jgi:hypothetical protein
VSGVNPFQIKSFAQSCLTRGKTDKIDAQLIARFCAERPPEPWQSRRPSKIGPSFLRQAIYMPALPTLYKTPWETLFRQRLAAAGKPPRLILGAMM